MKQTNKHIVHRIPFQDVGLCLTYLPNGHKVDSPLHAGQNRLDAPDKVDNILAYKAVP